MTTHKNIALFQTQAEVLDVAGSIAGLDDAVAELAGWIELARNRLSDDDRVVLTWIGGVLYREGLRRRNSGQ